MKVCLGMSELVWLEGPPVWSGSWTGCWLAAGQSSGKRAVAGQEPVALVTGEQTAGEEQEQLDEGELEVLPVGEMCLHLPLLGSWRTQWSWRGVLLVLPEVDWATVLRVD